VELHTAPAFPPAVVRNGKVLAPGAILTEWGGYTGLGLDIPGGLVRVYFDAGLNRPGTGDPPYVCLGYVICPMRGRVPTEPVAGRAYIDSLYSILRQGGLLLPRLEENDRLALADTRVGRGNELWDLVAAFLALVKLREVKYRGTVEGVTDNQSVIDFLTDPSANLTLQTNRMDVGLDMKSEINAVADDLQGGVAWTRVRRVENLADPILRERMERYIKGFQKGLTVREISDSRLID